MRNNKKRFLCWWGVWHFFCVAKISHRFCHEGTNLFFLLFQTFLTHVTHRSHLHNKNTNHAHKNVLHRQDFYHFHRLFESDDFFEEGSIQEDFHRA